MVTCQACGGTIKYSITNIGKCEYCGKLYLDNGSLASEKDLFEVYQNAVALMNSRNEDSILNAIAIFEELGNYRDCAQKAIACNDIIRNRRMAEEDERLRAERQTQIEENNRKKQEEHDKKIRRIKFYGILGITSVVALIIAVYSISSSAKKKHYQKAIELYNSNEYEFAIEEFSKAKGYSDSEDKIAEINKVVAARENKYEEGIKYFNSGMYLEAIGCLADCSDYLDSSEYIEKSSNNLYDEAQSLFDAGKLSEAIEKASAVPTSSQCSAMAQKLCNEANALIIEKQNEDTYQIAVSDYDAKDFENAQTKFLTISGYKDSKDYLDKIGATIYEQAKTMYASNDLQGAYTTLKLIDNSTKWSQYDSIKDFDKQVKDEYETSVRESCIANAKQTFYSEGKESALLVLKDGLAIIPNDSEINRIITNLNSVRTTNLENVLMDSRRVEFKSNGVQDYYGNEYAEYVRFSVDLDPKNTYARFNLSGEYASFSASIFRVCDGKWITGEKLPRIVIKGDGNVIYDSGYIDRSMGCDISLDVTGIDVLEMEANRTKGPDGNADLIMVNDSLSTNPF